MRGLNPNRENWQGDQRRITTCCDKCGNAPGRGLERRQIMHWIKNRQNKIVLVQSWLEKSCIWTCEPWSKLRDICPNTGHAAAEGKGSISGAMALRYANTYAAAAVLVWGNGPTGQSVLLIRGLVLICFCDCCNTYEHAPTATNRRY